MSIKPLPGDVVAQIKSSLVITCLNNVIAGLVKNSLDAGATRITISVDYSRGSCSIEDNGVGIPPSEFEKDAGLGQLHHTSKFPAHLHPDIHGKHGIFLASVASLSLLSITSHHRDFHSHNSMSIHNSKILTRNTPCLPEQRLLTFTHGTRVTVKDLFGSMPVRVKHRALQAEKSSFTRDWDRLALDLVALLISWPGAISLSISDAASRQSLNFKAGSEHRRWLNDSCRLLHQASLCERLDVSDWIAIGASSPTLAVSGFVCREPVATKRTQFISLGIEPLSNDFRCNILHEEVNKVFAASSFGLVEDESDEDKLPKKIKMDGFTQREVKTRKGVDRWPMYFLKMTPTTPSLDMDDVVDDRQPNLAVIIDLLKAMFFEFLKRNHCRPRKVVLSSKSKLSGQKQRGSSSKPDDLAFSATPKKGQQITSPILASGSDLTRESHRLQISDRRLDPSFVTWSKIKSGKALHTFEESASSRSRTQSGSATSIQRSRSSTPGRVTDVSRASTPTEPFRSSLFDASGKLTRKPFDDIEPQKAMSRLAARHPDPTPMPTQQHTPPSEAPPQDETVEWINPMTQMVTTINSRTGFDKAPKSLTLSRRHSEHKSKEDSRGAAERTRETTKATPWVADLISKWKNPVFELTEPPIPKLPDVVETLGLEPRSAGHHCHHGQAVVTVGTRHETAAISLQGRLSKDTLKKAQLIAQVDKKFILAKVPFDRVKGDAENDSVLPEPSSVVVLIDQHAADERYRVEELMAGYFQPSGDKDGRQVWKAVTEVLSKPVQFELSSQDKSLLSQFQQYFAYWGICYEVEAAALSDKDKNRVRGTKTKTSVRSLPPAILERCRADPRLLAGLIRKEAWRLKDEDKLARPPKLRLVSPKDCEGDVPVWVSLFHACPPGVVELINSRSCRSAIMFNDPLTLDECSHLLDRLIRCAFPFQCAHGRPSIVPLVDMGDEMVQLGNLMESSPTDGNVEGFGHAFTKWKKSKN